MAQSVREEGAGSARTRVRQAWALPRRRTQVPAATASQWIAERLEGTRELLDRLPDGGTIPPHGWRQRHFWITLGLWLHVPLLLLFGLFGHHLGPFLGSPIPVNETSHVFGEVALVALLAAVASYPLLSRRKRAAATSLGLSVSAALLVHMSGGMIEAHFHFLVLLIVISLYQDWSALALGIAFVAVHHTVAGAIEPASVYNHAGAIAYPVRWAGVHALFVTLEAGAIMFHWQATKRVQEHNERVVSAAGEGLVGFDETGHVSFINPAAESLLGRKDRVLGQPSSRLFAHHIPELLAADGRLRSLDEGMVHHGRGLRFTSADKETRFVDWSSVPLMMNGRVTGAVVTLRDVTERQWGESKLREQELQLSAAQRLAQVGSFEWAPVADFLRVSAEFTRILHDARPDEEPAVERLGDFLAYVHPDDAMEVEEAFHDLHTNGTPLMVDCRIGTGATMRHCELRARLDIKPDGRDAYRLIRGSCHDVTDRVRAEEMRLHAEAQHREIQLLREQDAFKNRFINAIAHELNTPLTPLRLQLHLLKLDPEGRLSERQKRAVSMLDRNVKRFGSLVEDLLDAARLQGGRLRMQRSVFQMEHLVEEVVEQFEGMMLERDLALEVTLDEAVVVRGDRDRLVQVVYNLLSNACKFTPGGGTIEVGLARIGDDAVVKVRDSGIGIDPDDQRRLFQPFMQIGDHMETTESGTGLGLYLSRGLIELHGGRLWCESEGTGKGATFVFAVPLARSIEEDIGPDIDVMSPFPPRSGTSGLDGLEDDDAGPGRITVRT